MTEPEALEYLEDWYSDIYPYRTAYDAVFDTVDQFLIRGQDAVIKLGDQKHGT